MKIRSAILLILLSNFALFVYLLVWVGKNEPHSYQIDGVNYDSESAPFVDPDVKQAIVPKGELLARVVMIGDAGDPAEINAENLAMLRHWTQEHLQKTVALYLGDNVYSYGFEPDKQSRSEAILTAQLDAGGARNIVIPGNHDWGHSHGNFVERVVAQQNFVDAWPGAEFYPRNGCPGPEVITLVEEDKALGRPVRLIMLDTQWMLIPLERPECDGVSFYQVMNRLEALLEQYQDDMLIVASHHPIRTTGPHGGFQRGMIRRIWQSLMGSQGTLGKPLYEAVMGDYSKAIGSVRPLIYVAGHEHSLQVHRGGDVAEYMLVSGAGAVKHVNVVTAAEDTLFAHAHAGFSVLDFLQTDAGRVLVLRMVEAGKGEVFAMVLAATDS